MSAVDSVSASWRALIEQAPDALIYCGRGGAIEVWNAAAERLFGYRAADVLGRSLDVIVPQRLRAAHWAGFERALRDGETRYQGRVMTTRAEHADGGRCYVDVCFALVREDGRVVGVLASARPGLAPAAAPLRET